MGKLRVLFQGDSITDMGRDRGDIRNMGSGYPLFVASNFRAARPNFDIDFLISESAETESETCAPAGRATASTFVPTCSPCSSALTTPGGDTTAATPRIQRSSSACTARCSRTRGAKIRALK